MEKYLVEEWPNIASLTFQNPHREDRGGSRDPRIERLAGANHTRLQASGLKKTPYLLRKCLICFNAHLPLSQVSLQEGCQRVLVSDCHSLLSRQVRGLARGLPVTLEDRCGRCGGDLVIRRGGGGEARDLLVFRCRHAYHADCLERESERRLCELCHYRRV